MHITSLFSTYCSQLTDLYLATWRLLNLVFLLILHSRTYADVAKASAYEYMLYTDP